MTLAQPVTSILDFANLPTTARTSLISMRRSLAYTLDVSVDDIVVSRSKLSTHSGHQFTAKIKGASKAALIRLAHRRSGSDDLSLSVIGGSMQAVADGVAVECMPCGSATMTFSSRTATAAKAR